MCFAARDSLARIAVSAFRVSSFVTTFLGSACFVHVLYTAIFSITLFTRERGF